MKAEHPSDKVIRTIEALRIMYIAEKQIKKLGFELTGKVVEIKQLEKV